MFIALELFEESFDVVTAVNEAVAGAVFAPTVGDDVFEEFEGGGGLGAVAKVK